MQGLDLPQYIRISGTVAGTTTVLNRKGNFHSVFIPTVKTGTASFYDNASGTSSATYLFDLSNAVSGSVQPEKLVGFRVHNGLTVVTGGTTDFLVVYE